MTTRTQKTRSPASKKSHKRRITWFTVAAIGGLLFNFWGNITPYFSPNIHAIWNIKEQIIQKDNKKSIINLTFKNRSTYPLGLENFQNELVITSLTSQELLLSDSSNTNLVLDETSNTIRISPFILNRRDEKVFEFIIIHPKNETANFEINGELYDFKLILK